MPAAEAIIKLDELIFYEYKMEISILKKILLTPKQRIWLIKLKSIKEILS
ncbi:hypothetical protein KH5_04320 [Urechidicola sp. KH5]